MFSESIGDRVELNENMNIDIKQLEGRYYIIGRDGHISIDSPLVSQQHAKISITDGRIHLRDLNSTNGTYLIRDDRLTYFDKGYVNLTQVIMIGNQRFTIQELLERAVDFVDIDDSPTQIQIPESDD